MELGKVELSTCCHPKPDGIELRDWFAGMALNGWYSTMINVSTDESEIEEVAAFCYETADAMMKARGKEGQ